MDESSKSGARRRTRSQVAPDWTVKDSLILVNEIAAVEADCSNTLSSFQKWKIISENCNALDVHRTLNQCRRKWEALLSDYNRIKQWKSQNSDGGGGGGGSCCSLSTETKKKLKVSENFNNQLFEVIDAVVMVQEDKAGTEPDSDPEAQAAEADNLDAITEQRAKRSRRCAVVAEKNPPRKIGKTKPQTNRTQEKAKKEQAEAKHRHEPVEGKLLESTADEEEIVNVEEEAEVMAVRLGEKADMIHDIVAGSLLSDDEARDDSSGGLKMEFVKRQGDQLIACLGEIVDTLDKLRQLSQEF